MKYEAEKPTRVISPKGGRIGIPRTLGFDELRVFFDEVLEAHGLRPVVSRPSGAATLERGLVRCIDEVCFPLKTFFGHVATLEQDGIDTVLVPRLVSLAKGRNLCPKFHVLPDLIAHAFPDLNVVAPYVDLHHSRRATLEEHLADLCVPMLRELGVFSRSSARIIARAWRLFEESERDDPEPAPAPDADTITVAVLGHLYAERDPFLGLGVTRHLKRLGARVVHGPSRTPDEITDLEEGMYYESSVREARSIERAIASGVDGIVLLTYFACGPDSYGAETFSYRLARRAGSIPFLRLILDEQTAAEGLVTRLATFVDVARLRKKTKAAGC